MLKKLIFPLLSTSMLIQGSNLLVLADEFDNLMNNIEVFEDEMIQESSLTGSQFSETHKEIAFNFSGLNLVDSSDPQKTVQFSLEMINGFKTITLKSSKGYGTFKFLTDTGFYKDASGEYTGCLSFPSGYPQPTFNALDNPYRNGWTVFGIYYSIKGNVFNVQLEDRYGEIESWSCLLPQDASAYIVSSNGDSNNTPINQDGEMYRLYNPNSGEHFYTGNINERNQLSSMGWKYEGIGWYAPPHSNTPVYRLYNQNSKDHHYTTDQDERDTLIRAGWKDEGIGWYSDDNKGEPLYRIYNPNSKTAGSHHYTLDSNEKNRLVSIGWKDEGIAWYGLK